MATIKELYDLCKKKQKAGEKLGFLLKAFGKGQGFISGATVKFPLQIYINYHKELEWDEIGRENFIQQNLDEWSGGGKKAAEQSDKDNERVSKILKK